MPRLLSTNVSILRLLLLSLLAMPLLASCRLRDSGAEQLVVAELVRTNLYLAPNGSDSNPGTRAEPFRTLARAVQVATPGTTVHVAPGIYSGGVRSNTHGTPEARIVFQSTERWGARLVPPLDARQSAAWDNRANYVDIIGFDIDGSQYQSGMKWVSGIYNGGSHNGVHNNRVHHIGTDVPCEPKGGAGIGIDSYFKGSDGLVTGNQVHDIGPPECSFMHGIYVSTTASVRPGCRASSGIVLDWDYPHPFILPVVPRAGDIDGLDHTNNAVYVRWCEQAGWAHSESLGLTLDDYRRLDRAMAIRRGEYDYLLPTVLGEPLRLATWLVGGDGKLSMERRFQLVRDSDGATVMRGAWDLVCIEIASGRPRRMPPEFLAVYMPVVVPGGI